MILYFGEKSIEFEKFSFALAETFEHVNTQSELFDRVSRIDHDEILILGSDNQLHEAISIAERLRIDFPSFHIVLSRKRIDVDTLTKALRAGIAEVVSAEDTSSFVQSIRQLRNLFGIKKSKFIEKERNQKKGKVIVVFSAKGGCGKTTVSINIASVLSEIYKKKVCLVDLDLQFGDVAVSLQANPEKTISSTIGMGTNLDLFGTRSIITNHKERLDLLLAPTNPTDVEFISGEIIENVLNNLVLDYEYVVIDTPPAFTDFVLKSMEMMDICYLITTLEMPSIKNMKIVLETLDALKIDKELLRIVINKSDLKTGVTVEESEALLNRKINYLLPNESSVPVSTNQGNPLVTYAPKTALSKVFVKMGSDLLESMEPKVESKKTRKFFSLKRGIK